MTHRRLVGAGVAAVLFFPAVAVAAVFELDWRVGQLMRSLHRRRFGGRLPS